jgi:hypothetical protein
MGYVQTHTQCNCLAVQNHLVSHVEGRAQTEDVSERVKSKAVPLLPRRRQERRSIAPTHP